MTETKQTLEDRKKAALDAAEEAGIIDVVQAGGCDLNNLEALELATKLMKEHGHKIYKDLAEHREKGEN